MTKSNYTGKKTFTKKDAFWILLIIAAVIVAILLGTNGATQFIEERKALLAASVETPVHVKYAAIHALISGIFMLVALIAFRLLFKSGAHPIIPWIVLIFITGLGVLVSSLVDQRVLLFLL